MRRSTIMLPSLTFWHSYVMCPGWERRLQSFGQKKINVCCGVMKCLCTYVLFDVQEKQVIWTSVLPNTYSTFLMLCNMFTQKNQIVILILNFFFPFQVSLRLRQWEVLLLGGMGKLNVWNMKDYFFLVFSRIPSKQIILGYNVFFPKLLFKMSWHPNWFYLTIKRGKPILGLIQNSELFIKKVTWVVNIPILHLSLKFLQKNFSLILNWFLLFYSNYEGWEISGIKLFIFNAGKSKYKLLQRQHFSNFHVFY